MQQTGVGDSQECERFGEGECGAFAGGEVGPQSPWARSAALKPATRVPMCQRSRFAVYDPWVPSSCGQANTHGAPARQREDSRSIPIFRGRGDCRPTTPGIARDKCQVRITTRVTSQVPRQGRYSITYALPRESKRLLRASRERGVRTDLLRDALAEIRMHLKASQVEFGYTCSVATKVQQPVDTLNQSHSSFRPNLPRPANSGRAKQPSTSRGQIQCTVVVWVRSAVSIGAGGHCKVGFEPAFGFFHTPRSAAHPLVMDVMELFRVPIWDVPSSAH